MDSFEIKVEVIRTSQLNVPPGLEKTELVIAYLKAAGADVYISGPSGRNYLEFEKFSPDNLELKLCQFQHPVYRQRYLGFEPNMSAIDLLFNLGPKAKEIITASASLESSPCQHKCAC